MSNIEQHLGYLGGVSDVLHIQDHILATAIKGLIHAFPPGTTQDIIEPIQLVFKDALDELDYEDSPHIDLFHDIAYALFHKKERQSAGETG